MLGFDGWWDGEACVVFGGEDEAWTVQRCFYLSGALAPQRILLRMIMDTPLARRDCSSPLEDPEC